ncbi:hypothetical protein CHS0354_027211 [Potamilus streckersoni]|uniref:Cyclic nucleotide-binding domain-containing protein n=1 Tax=Potamilus streckersoni TaxID=2493646 RepID=A0AAE0W520_9BIVA|nr:hypothetical protein CHS0354_027211 [Potamilus streckersoni]
MAGGRARLTAEPYKYRQQFPSLFGEPTGKHKNQNILREDTTISELVSFKKQVKGGRHLANMEPLSYIRRSDGYVAVEKIHFDKMIDLCFIEEGEVICDSELLLGLEYNLFNVICSSACTFYTLNTRTFDRLIFKKNSYTLNMMKILTETKLSRRLATSQGKRIQILSPLLFHILNVRVVDPYVSEKPQDGGNRLQVNQKLNRSETVLVDWFMKGKTPLLQPITKNAIYYRELIQKRARLRKIARIRGPKKTEEYRSLQRRIRDAYHSNYKETLKAQTTMKNLSMRKAEVTQVNRWK